MKTILATGGLGFVGSHTCVALLQKGYDVLVIDSLVNSSEDILKNLNKILQKGNTTINKFTNEKKQNKKQTQSIAILLRTYQLLMNQSISSLHTLHHVNA